jgi:nicotinamidase-related amidase
MPQKHFDQQTSDQVFIQQADVALTIIDIQEKLVPVMQNQELLIQNAVRLVKFANILKIPVIFTEQEKLGNTVLSIRNALQDIQPITKLAFDCFRCQGFTDELERLNRKVLVVAGIEAHICVTQTVLHALRDFKVQVVADAISARFKHNHEIALQRMQAAGATITSTEMFIYEILGKAGTDIFREVLKLVK